MIGAAPVLSPQNCDAPGSPCDAPGNQCDAPGDQCDAPGSLEAAISEARRVI